MRIRACLVLTLVLAGPLAAQEKSRWVRVYTYDDAVIEMEEVAFTFGNFGRVRFRTVFEKPQALPGKPGAEYKTIAEDLEFMCTERVYRVRETAFLDRKGDVVSSYKADESGPWKRVKSDMMQRLFDPACRMIEKRKL